MPQADGTFIRSGYAWTCVSLVDGATHADRFVGRPKEASGRIVAQSSDVSRLVDDAGNDVADLLARERQG